MKKFIASLALFELFICSIYANYGQAPNGYGQGSMNGYGQGYNNSYSAQGGYSAPGNYSNQNIPQNYSGGAYNQGAYQQGTYQQGAYQSRNGQVIQQGQQGNVYPQVQQGGQQQPQVQGSYSQPIAPQVNVQSPLADQDENNSDDEDISSSDTYAPHIVSVNTVVLQTEPKYPKDRFKSSQDQSINKKIRNQITGWFSDHYKEIIITTADGAVVIDGIVDNIDDQKLLDKEVSKINDVNSFTNNTKVKEK